MERKKRYTNNEPDLEVKISGPRLEIMNMLYEMELASTSMLKLLLPKRGNHGIRRILKDLHSAGVIEKLNVGLYEEDIYKISEYGVEKITEYSSLPFRYVNTYRPRGTGRVLPLHAQMIANTLGNIRGGAIQQGIDIISHSQILSDAGHASDRTLKLPVTATHTFKDGHSETKESEIEPDGLLGIPFKDGTTKYIAIEDQNEGHVRVGNLRQSSMLRKFLWYHDAFKNKTFKKEWDIDNLSVLFRFKKLEDYTASVKLAGELFGKAPMFLFRHDPPFEVSEKSGKLLAPKPKPALFTDDLTRAGMPPQALYTPD